MTGDRLTHDEFLQAKTDPDMMEAVMDKVWKKAYGVAVKHGLGEEAQDAAQDASMKVYRNLERYGGNGTNNPHSWVHTIAANTCVDYHRRRPNGNVISLDKEVEGEEGPQRAVQEPADQRNNIESHLDRQDYWSIIGELPASQEKTNFLHHLNGYKYREISEKTGQRMGTVKSTIFRARNQLQELFRSRLQEYVR